MPLLFTYSGICLIKLEIGNRLGFGPKVGCRGIAVRLSAEALLDTSIVGVTQWLKEKRERGVGEVEVLCSLGKGRKKRRSEKGGVAIAQNRARQRRGATAKVVGDGRSPDGWECSNHNLSALKRCYANYG